MRVVTRFAPSPTGMLHIGGARTALFNYLFARANGGRFLLRIEDTDQARSTEAATQAILDAMNWLGLTPDEPPVMQSAQAERHAAIAHEMVDRGTAFRCYTTQEELQARRDLGEQKRELARDPALSDAARASLVAEAHALLAPYRSPWRDGGTPADPSAPFVVRLRAPDGEDRVLMDGVQGTVRIKASELDDLVMLRNDNTPTYMLAVVVDDHDMDVTHVIRGDDHLRNAFRQIPIYEAMGWDVPAFAHVPMIHGADGAKLSKRHGDLSTLAYREMGYLPEAMKAYLLRLGWSHGDQEIFSDEEAIKVFDIAGINKAPARLDLDKLGGVNSHFMRQCEDARLFDLLLPFLQQDGPLEPIVKSRIVTALPHMKARGNTLPELATAFRFLALKRPISLNPNALKALSEEKRELLRGLARELRPIDPWTSPRLLDAITAYCSAANLTIGQIGPAIRAALTGGLPAPELAPVLEWLGKEEALGRIEDQITA